MAKPRRTTAEAFFDVFADFPIDEQAAALKIMEQIHRLAKRDAGRKTIAAANETGVYVEIPMETPPKLDLRTLEEKTRPAISGGMEDQDS